MQHSSPWWYVCLCCEFFIFIYTHCPEILMFWMTLHCLISSMLFNYVGRTQFPNIFWWHFYFIYNNQLLHASLMSVIMLACYVFALHTLGVQKNFAMILLFMHLLICQYYQYNAMLVAATNPWERNICCTKCCYEVVFKFLLHFINVCLGVSIDFSSYWPFYRVYFYWCLTVWNMTL